MRFVKPRNPNQPTRYVFVGNCGPYHGVSVAEIQEIFAPFSNADITVHVPYKEAAHVYIIFSTATEAAAAVHQLSGKPCPAIKGQRPLKMSFSELDSPTRQVQQQQLPVALTAEQAGIPGLQLHLDFITPDQESALLQHIDAQPWQQLSKRRVQHYGFKFEYSQRGVDPQQRMGQLPDWSQPLLQRMEVLPDVLPLDQLTVNEYRPGVGLSAHIDTHSAFSGAILSLSLAGGCVMEFRKPYSSSSSTGGNSGSSRSTNETAAAATAAGSASGSSVSQNVSSQHTAAAGSSDDAAAAAVAAGGSRPDADADAADAADADADAVQQVLVYLPPRSLLVMGGEARYAWQHYIPHRKSDWVNGQLVQRAARRVSLTFRQVRGYPCSCSYPEYCDSQLGALPPTRIAQLQQQQQQQIAPDSAPQLDTPSLSASTTTAAAAAAEAAVSNGTTTAATAAAAAFVADADAAAAAMESLHVHQVYDAIASHFSATRFAVWPKVRTFLESLAANCVVADVGCGNGKYFGVRRDLAVLGSDRSTGLAGVAAQRLAGGNTAAATGQAPIASPAADVLVCDGLHLPYRCGSCDAVLCIAVLHHIGSRARRLLLLQQLANVLVPGGRALVTVWATDQEDPAKTILRWKKLQDGRAEQVEQQQQQQQGEQREQQQQQQQEGSSSVAAAANGPDYLVPWHLPFHKAAGLVKQPGGAAQQQQGCSAANSGTVVAAAAVCVDQSKGAVVLQRYYHLFEQYELEGLVAEVPGVKVVDGFYDRSNWCVIFQKVAV